MAAFSLQLTRLNDRCAHLIDTLSARPRLAAGALLALALLTYLPGLIQLPPVDRTEVVYAEMARGMLERGEPLDARFVDERFEFRPIGITWLQAGTAHLLGRGAWGEIATYRLPSLIAAVLAVLAVWWLLGPLVGKRRALIAAALFAVAPIVALQAELAIPEGPLLLTIVVAQLALLRLYCLRENERGLRMALAFWIAQGLAILLNALAVPILSLTTLIALFVFDRNLAWLKRLRPLIGVPLMVGIAAPWLLVRAHLDGVPFSGLTWGEFIRALGGAQDMKWKAAPFTFTLGLVLGFLPGALALVPAMKGLWEQRRNVPLHRFLLAWIVGYLVYLELISSKPALYTVQAMFPAAAAAVALALDRGGRLVLPRYMLRPQPLLIFVALTALIVGLIYLHPANAVGIAGSSVLVVAVLTLAANAARARLAAAWLVLSIVGFALFIPFIFGLVLPNLERGWPAARIAEAVQPLRDCIPGPVPVLGLREPSTVFLLGGRGDPNPDAIAARMADGTPAIAVVEDRWHGDLLAALAKRGLPLPERSGCVEGFNVMRGCPMSFSIYVSGGPAALAPGCAMPERYACRKPVPAPAGPPNSRCR